MPTSNAASMSEYLSSFILNPVSRFSRRISSGQDAQAVLPGIPESLRIWYPTRLWKTSLPQSISENETEENIGARRIRPRAALMPSPPLDPVETTVAEEIVETSARDPDVSTFPALDHQSVQPPGPARLQGLRAESDTTLNPMRELHDRSRIFEDITRGHSQSDPTTTLTHVNNLDNENQNIEPNTSFDASDSNTRSRDGSAVLPEDDGMGPLRSMIRGIWTGNGTPAEKSQRIHHLMMASYTSTQLQRRPKQGAPSSGCAPKVVLGTAFLVSDGTQTVPHETTIRSSDPTPHFNLTTVDLAPSYAPIEPPEFSGDENCHDLPTQQLGCKHYMRNVKLQCHTCQRWYTCRICHDEAEDHVLPRRETKNMLCMICMTPQAAAQTCNNCQQQAGSYYCAVCKLWSSDPEKSIYHCDDCGICRLGQGLGKDFFHCTTCSVCMTIGVEASHRCIERSTKCDCPICGEYLFTSALTVVFMKCGHSIHEECFKELCKASYKCPMCSKSIANMETQFRSLDRQIEAQPMPAEYQGSRVFVYCNDCTAKSFAKFHWLGLKCTVCESYNTTMLDHPIDRSGNVQPSEATNEVGIHATPVLPYNLTDEAVPIPTSLAASRRPSIVNSEAVERSRSPWLRPQSRVTRSASPVVSNYFGLDHRDRAARPTGVANEDEDLNFWGASSPTMHHGGKEGSLEETDEETSNSDEEMEDPDEVEDEDEDEDDDQMNIFGHR